jgi:hypothetical protein
MVSVFDVLSKSHGFITAKEKVRKLGTAVRGDD